MNEKLKFLRINKVTVKIDLKDHFIELQPKDCSSDKKGARDQRISKTN